MRGILGFGGGLTSELEEGCFNLSWHGGAHISVDVVPLECEAEIFLPGPVLGDLVILPEGFEQVIGVCLPCVIDPKILDDGKKKRGLTCGGTRGTVCVGPGHIRYLLGSWLVGHWLVARID